ncbi:energy transducer TonB [Sphingopyxis sp. J-6]|uniref:energy transducer TonB n=1 Tax=Sphingopyxis sp. J-6 TaxID=3122054 RepID=UPI00398431E9
MLLMTMMLAFGAPQGGAASPPSADLSEPGAPATNPGGWVTNDDYPPQAMREEREGVTGFRLTYDNSGLPRKCEIVSSSGHADLDAATCDLVMERALFEPGKDRTGMAVGGTYTNRIRWSIPEGAPAMPGPLPFSDPGRMTLQYVLDAEGGVASCEGHVEGLVAPAGDQSAAVDLCQGVEASAPYPPPLDSEGKPVSRRYRMTIEVVTEDIGRRGDVPK